MLGKENRSHVLTSSIWLGEKSRHRLALNKKNSQNVISTAYLYLYIHTYFRNSSTDLQVETQKHYLDLTNISFFFLRIAMIILIKTTFSTILLRIFSKIICENIQIQWYFLSGQQCVDSTRQLITFYVLLLPYCWFSLNFISFRVLSNWNQFQWKFDKLPTDNKISIVLISKMYLVGEFKKKWHWM